jgi:hypothetical protein
MLNTALGFIALTASTTGNFNTAIGGQTLNHVTTGSDNVALGFDAGFNLTTGDNNIDIGGDVQGVAGESNTIRIGDNLPNTAGASACYIGGINGQTATGGTAVYIDTTGRLGTITSSKRFKQDIKQMGTASEALFSLKPVSFRYKKQIDPAGTAQLGLVAEDVEKVNPDLIVRDKEGKPYSVRYDQVNAMLLNEFLKAHKSMEDLEARDAQQQKQIEAVTKQLRKQAAQIQKVSAQLELSKAAPKTVLNRQ